MTRLCHSVRSDSPKDKGFKTLVWHNEINCDILHVLSLQCDNNTHFFLDHSSGRWVPPPGSLCSCVTTCNEAAGELGRGQDRVARNLDCQMDLNAEYQTTALKRVPAPSLLVLNDSAAQITRSPCLLSHLFLFCHLFRYTGSEYCVATG